MIVKRAELNWWERLYIPTLLGGIKVTWRHFARTVFRRKSVTMQYPEEKWVVPQGYRGAPYLVKDQDGNTKCVSCQLCEFVCPPRAIRIVPPGPEGQPADRRNAEKMPKEFEINMLRCIFCGYCEDACPTQAIELGHEHQLSFTSRRDAIFTKEMLIDPVPEGGEDTPQAVEPGTYDRAIPDMPAPK